MSDARHRSTQALLCWFDYEHLPMHLADISRLFADLADQLVEQLPDSDELSAGLRKLLESKDWIVRAAVLKGHQS